MTAPGRRLRGEAAGTGGRTSRRSIAYAGKHARAQFEALERDQQGFATISGLLAVINPMRNLPGTKDDCHSFSEGIALPTASCDDEISSGYQRRQSSQRRDLCN